MAPQQYYGLCWHCYRKQHFVSTLEIAGRVAETQDRNALISEFLKHCSTTNWSMDYEGC